MNAYSDCILCELPDSDVVTDDGSPAHLTCVQKLVCEQQGHELGDDERCYCGAVEVVETKGLML